MSQYPNSLQIKIHCRLVRHNVDSISKSTNNYRIQWRKIFDQIFAEIGSIRSNLTCAYDANYLFVFEIQISSSKNQNWCIKTMLKPFRVIFVLKKRNLNIVL